MSFILQSIFPQPNDTINSAVLYMHINKHLTWEDYSNNPIQFSLHSIGRNGQLHHELSRFTTKNRQAFSEGYITVNITNKIIHWKQHQDHRSKIFIKTTTTDPRSLGFHWSNPKEGSFIRVARPSSETQINNHNLQKRAISSGPACRLVSRVANLPVELGALYRAIATPKFATIQYCTGVCRRKYGQFVWEFL